MFLAPSLAIHLALAAAPGVNLTSIPREIAVEPKYQSGDLAFCLLVFGQKAQTRVWLVQDGNRLYIDRNGNGDLTEEGEMVEGNGLFHDEGRIREADGTEHSRLLVQRFYDSRRCRVRIFVRGEHQQSAGFGQTRLEFAARPQDAPILHFNGPLTFARYSDKVTLPRDIEGKSFRVTSLRVLLGSRGLGEGTFAGYHCSLFDHCDTPGVTARIEYPSAHPCGPPQEEEQFLPSES
jgi:hypothetical protein